MAFPSQEKVPPHEYSCGLVSGEEITVVKAIPRYDHEGVKVGEHAEGKTWKVLRPSINVASGEPDNSAVWLRQPGVPPVVHTETWQETRQFIFYTSAAYGPVKRWDEYDPTRHKF